MEMSMSKFRKKPVVISAERFLGCDQLTREPGSVIERSSYVAYAGLHGQETCSTCGARLDQHIEIPTLEGSHLACPGDWILEGVKGEFYPCKPDIFELTYEPEVPEVPLVAETLTLGAALELIKSGHRLARRGWNGKGMFIFLVPGSRFVVNRAPWYEVCGEGNEVSYQAHVDMRTADGTFVPWQCSQSDLLAEDWVVLP
jgi:hypothetical protein